MKQIYDTIYLLSEQDPKNKIIKTDMQSLIDEVNNLTKARKLQIENLTDRENYRREFLGNVSHELKTPLFTVQGYISTLIDGKITDKEIQKKYLQRAEYGVERLISLVEDLDLITKLENTELHLNYSSFNIIELIQEVFDLLELKAKEQDIVLVFDRSNYQSITVYADREKIKQVLLNLIENSIKYGRSRGTTEVSIEDLTTEKFIIRITDNGCGIEEKHIKRLFERFYRVDKHRSRAIGGSGLGLAIVKHVIEAHKNHLYVESEHKIGSEFSFTIDKNQ